MRVICGINQLSQEEIVEYRKITSIFGTELVLTTVMSCAFYHFTNFILWECSQEEFKGSTNTSYDTIKL